VAPLADRLRGLRGRSRRLWRWFFPPEVQLPEETRQLLAAVYPTLDLRRVSFHSGYPHLLKYFPGQGIALPAVLSPWRSRIYIRPWAWETGTVRGLGLLLHEAYHALQIQEAGPGLGLLRPFLILYLACSAGVGFLYHRHPMEKDAYRLAGRNHSLFESTFRDGPELLEPLLAPLATPTSGLRFWRRLAASTPIARRLFGLDPALSILLGVLSVPLVALWLAAWTLATAVLWLLRLLVEGTGMLIVALLWLTGTLAIPLRWGSGGGGSSDRAM
jgi:hypothetical protein